MLKTTTETVKYTARYLRHKLTAFAAFGVVDGAEPHSVVTPIATYSPWRADRLFEETFRVVRDNTLVDIYRCHELWCLIQESAALSEGDILEVGVWRGGSGCLMARRAQLLQMPASVYLCDTFAGVVKATAMDRHYSGGEHSDTSAELVRALASTLGLDNVRLLSGIFPDETGNQIAGNRFRLCHIDVDVYQSARATLDWVWPRMPAGGIVIFDDYGFLSTSGITRLVNEERGKPDRIIVHNLNGHGLLIKIGK